MNWTESEILAILDDCAQAFTFPALDNGYVYPAKVRLSVFTSEEDWALVIEVFGFSPRSGDPDVHVHTFSSRISRSKGADSYVTEEAFENYLKNNPNNESSFFYPISNHSWIDQDDGESAIESASILLRNTEYTVPNIAELIAAGIEPEENVPLVFEVCRWLADKEPLQVLANDQEIKTNLPNGVSKLLDLEEWNHPDTVGEELPSQNECFQQLAKVLVSGDISHYQPTEKPNTHWQNWPEAGTL